MRWVYRLVILTNLQVCSHFGISLSDSRLYTSLQAEVVALIEEAGFEARVVGRGAVPDSDSAILRVSGMTCSSCSSAVELALLNHQGVQVYFRLLIMLTAAGMGDQLPC